jgi:hypothetical protein
MIYSIILASNNPQNTLRMQLAALGFYWTKAIARSCLLDKGYLFLIHKAELCSCCCQFRFGSAMSVDLPRNLFEFRHSKKIGRVLGQNTQLGVFLFRMEALMMLLL